MTSEYRLESFGDHKIRIVPPKHVDTLQFARLIANEKDANNNDDAFGVLNLSCLIDRYFEWKQKLPRIEPFYAVKCNDDPVLLRVLASLGAGFDCASRGEIEAVASIKCVDVTSRIVFANPCKIRSHIAAASAIGVVLMTFDNVEELHKMAANHKAPETILRIGVSDPSALCQLGGKYGAEPLSAAPRLLESAAELGIRVVGVSFHVGSGCRDPRAFGVAIAHARRLFNFGKSLGHKMRILDIGGGFPGFDSIEVTFDKIVDVIRPAIDEHFGDDNDVQIIAEPGRFFAAAPMSLVANVIAAVKVDSERMNDVIDGNNVNTGNVQTLEPPGGFMYYVNDGVYGSFNCILFDHYQPHSRPLFDALDDDDETSTTLHSTTIWGPTCDALDQIERLTQMRRLNVGDFIYWPQMGAYTTVAASNFNGFEKPHTFYFIDEAAWRALQTADT